MALTHPHLFERRFAHVVVETQGRHTRGMTLVDMRDQRDLPAPNCDVLMDIDADAGFTVMTEAIAHFSH